MLKILRLVMAGGLGFVVINTLGMFICVPAFPLNSACAQLSADGTKALQDSGFFVISGWTMLSSTFYVITGRWKLS